MEKTIILDHATTCDYCGKKIETGEPVYPVYATNEHEPGVPLEEINSEWILSICGECGK